MVGSSIRLLLVAASLASAAIASAEPTSAATPAPAAQPAPGCGDSTTLLNEWLIGHAYLDVHLLSEVLAAICPDGAMRPHWYVTDAIALERLDDSVRAAKLLERALATPAAERARVVQSWIYLRNHDQQAFQVTLARTAPAAKQRLLAFRAIGDVAAFRTASARLPTIEAQDAGGLHRRYLAARRQKRPWLAGTMSTLLPGSGQIYAGSWEAGALAFILNGVLIASTVELVDRELYFSAGAVGVAASIFYVGNIVSAVDLADRRNQRASADSYEDLERTLLPELSHP